MCANPEPGVAGYYLQAEPARKLPNLKNTKVLIVTADASFASPGNPGGVAFLKQAGVQAEELRLGALGIKGNGHMMMVGEEQPRGAAAAHRLDEQERDRQQQPGAGAAAAGQRFAGAQAGRHRDLLGRAPSARRCPTARSTSGQMFVQYLEPAQQRHPLPVLLVHGGGGQMRALHGTGRQPRAGRTTSCRPATRCIWSIGLATADRRIHPDALGEIGPLVTYDLLTRDTVTSARDAEQAVARHDRRRRRPAGRSAVGGRQLHAAQHPAGAGPVAAARRRAGRSHRALHAADPLGRRALRLAGGQRAAESGQGGRVVRRRHGAARRPGRGRRARRCPA